MKHRKGERGEVYPDAAGAWRWRLIDGNNLKTAMGGEAFDSKDNAKRAFRQVFPFKRMVVLDEEPT